MNQNSNKIVFVSMTNYMGGAENVINTISSVNKSPVLFLKRVFEKCLPTNESSQHFYLTTKPLAIGFLVLLKAIYKYRKDYTIVSSHPYLNAYLGILKRIGYLKSKLIVRESTLLFTRYSGLKRFSYKMMYSLGYPSVNKVICQSELMKKELLEHNAFIDRDKALVLGNPVDLDQIYKLADNPLPEMAGQKYICAAGRLIELKGFDILIESFAKIAAEISDVNLVILGDGPQLANLENLIGSPNLQKRIKLAGHVSNPYPYFKNASLCVVSSLIEGFPNVLLQMIALNDHVVSTLCAGGIEDIPFITTVPTNNVDELSKAMLFALTDSELKVNNDEVKSKFFQIRKPKYFLDAALS
ncbi:MAG: hypothetical protein JWN56_2027 [Sphingobacteriales bacterium]|nr:hypothetical protein [Sphingobacteriales bacterium]